MGTYYMPAPNASMANKLWTWLRTGDRFRPSFPRAIQFQTSSFCNARCAFCGYTHHHKDLEQGVITDELFKKIADECCSHYMGRISPYLMNEPLMDKKIAERIAYITKHKKVCTKTKINSNGALLSEDMSRGLIDSGLDQLWISVNGYSKETYNDSMNLDIDQTLGNVDKFLELRTQKGKKRPKLIITTIRTSLVEPEIEYAKKYWSTRDVTFKTHALDNRSGVDINWLQPADKQGKAPQRRKNCDLFLKQAYIIYNGDMVLCCHDWKRTVKLGNVGEKSIKEIWNSKYFIELIYQHLAQDFTNMELCRTCG